MSHARLAVGLVAAVPALLFGGILLSHAATDPSGTALGVAGLGALLVAGAALALAGLQQERPEWVPPGAAAMIVGSAPLFLGHIGVVVVLSALALVVLSRPAQPNRPWRVGAGALALAAVATVAWLAGRGLGAGRAPSVVDMLLWACALGFVAVAAWPARRAAPRPG